jgi:hypothetical protein
MRIGISIVIGVKRQKKKGRIKKSPHEVWANDYIQN